MLDPTTLSAIFLGDCWSAKKRIKFYLQAMTLSPKPFSQLLLLLLSDDITLSEEKYLFCPWQTIRCLQPFSFSSSFRLWVSKSDPFFASGSPPSNFDYCKSFVFTCFCFSCTSYFLSLQVFLLLILRDVLTESSSIKSQFIFYLYFSNIRYWLGNLNIKISLFFFKWFVK